MTGKDNEFTINLISSASMHVFRDNTLASFRNQLSQPIQLEGEWQVALQSISFPTDIKNVTSTTLWRFNAANAEEAPGSPTSISREDFGTQIQIPEGVYKNVFQLLEEIKDKADFDIFNYDVNRIDGKLELKFGYQEGLTFEDSQIPSLLGFDGSTTSGISVNNSYNNQHVHIGYKTDPLLYALGVVGNEHVGTWPVDITCGSQFIFIYIDIIEHQYVGDTRAPLLKIIDSGRRVENGSITSQEPVQHKSITNLEFKRLLTNTIHSIKVELRGETGNLIPFVGTGKVVLSLRFTRAATAATASAR